MAGGESLGNLYFDLGLRDDSFEASFKSKMDKYKKMELNVGVKIDSESAKKAISATTDALKNSSKVDFSSTITPLVTRLKEARSELNVFKELMSETKNIGKKLEIRTNIKDTENELESLMRQIKALNSAQSSLNIKTSPNSLIPSRSIQDEGSLSSMRAYYTQLENDANNFAKAESAAAKEAVKASKDIETAKRQASNSASRDALNASKGNTELAKETLIRQKIQKEIENTALAHKRLEAFGTQSQSRIRSNSEFTNKTLLSQRQIAMQLSNQFGTMFSIYAVERFVKKLAEVRGEFEQQKIALSAILQDGQQANIIFEQIKNLSVESPFKFKDLVGYTKQLSAFQIPASELFDTMKRLADVSSGLGVGMDRVVLAFGQVRSASVLRGQELRQFSEMGIPMIQMLADKFSLLEKRTVSTGDVFERISKRMVSFNDVKDIFDDMTGAGGKFYEMQEKQAKGLLGMMTNLQDAIDIALNDIGETNEGVLKGAVQLTTTLINNWESVARIVMAAVTAYGAYKAVLIVTAATQKLILAYNTASYFISMTKAISGATTAQLLFNAACNVNPLVLLASVLAATVGAMILFGDGAESSKDKIEAMNKSIAETAKSTAKVDELVKAYERLSSKSEKTADEQKRLQVIVKELSVLYPDLVSKTDSYGHALDVNIQKIKNYSTAMKQVSLELARNSIEKAKMEIAEKQSRQRELDSAFLTGKVRRFIPSESGGSYITEKLSISEKDRLTKEYAANQVAVDGFLGTIQNAADLINSIKGNAKKAKTEISDWASWAKNFKDQTDKLGISKSISELFTQQNMEGGSAEFKSSLQKMYDDDLKQYEIYVKSKGLFSTEEISQLKKKVSDEKAAIDILGGVDKKGGSSSTPKDKIAIQLENDIKLVKALYSEYEKLEKVQSKDRAKELISKAPEYSNSREKLAGLGVSLSFSEEELNKQILALISRAKQTPKVKEIGASWAANIDKGFSENFNDTYENIIKRIEQTISDYKPKYDLYEKLLGLTGDRKKSSQLAFGRDAVDDYETFLRAQYAKLPSATFFSELAPPAEGATEEVKKAWKDLVEYIQSKKLGKIEHFEQIISEASSASDKIKVIELKREQDILDAKKAFANDPAQMKLAVDAVKSTSEQQINEIRSQLFQLTPLYDEVFKDLGKVAAGNLDDLLAKTNGLVNLVKTKGEPKKGSNGETTGYFLKAGVTDTNSGLKIEKDTLISVEKYNDLIERTNSIVNKINENPFKALFNPPKGATTETVEEKAKRIAGAIQGISDLANSVAGDLGGVMDSFGASNESKESLNNIMNLATGAAQAGTGVAKLAAGDIVGGIKDLASGIAKTIMSLNAMHDAKYEKQIKEYQKQIDTTAKSYDKLTDALSRKTEASKVDAQAEEYNLLQREKSLLEAQKRAEEAKKKTDQSKIDDYNKQIEDATKKQQELALNTLNYILGGSIGAQSDSWAKTLTDAMDTAFQNGTDAAKAWGDSVDTIVRDIAKNFIVNSFLGNQLQGWLEAASADWTDANKNINQSAIEADLKGFSEFAKSLEPATEAALKALNSIYGDGKTGTSGTGLTGEIKGVTEDTAQRLASLLNAIRQDSGVNRLAFAEMKNILSEFNRGSIEANSYLNKINENTRLTAENTAAIVRAFNDVTGVGSQGKALRVL